MNFLKISPLFLFLFSCDMSLDQRVMVNTYSSVVYSQDFGEYDNANQKGLTGPYVEIKNDFLKEKAFNLTPSWGRSFYLIRFYQDRDFKCFLFQYKINELKEIEKNSSSSNPVFLIEKHGIKVLSRKEYEKIKSTFQPHPYDEKRCKQLPDDDENKIYKTAEDYLMELFVSGDPYFSKKARDFPFLTEEENFEWLKKNELIEMDKGTGKWILKKK